MPPRVNPLRLNALQLKTLVILQQLARQQEPGAQPTEDGAVRVPVLPRAHHGHFHLGDRIVMVKDCTGLTNNAVFNALGRKELIRPGAEGELLLTAEGRNYPTGMDDQILHRPGNDGEPET